MSSISNFSSPSYGFPEMTPRDRQTRTNEYLRELGEKQICIVRLAIDSREGFESWMIALLKRHWYSILVRHVDKPFEWDSEIAEMRTGDIYFNQSLDIPSSGAVAISERAQHLEVWFNRYLARSYGEKLPDHVFQRIAEMALGQGTESAGLLTKRLREAAIVSDPVSPAEVAVGVYRLLSFEYISNIEKYLANNPVRLKIAKKLIDECKRLMELVIAINRPVQLQYAREYYGRNQSVCLEIDDLVGTAARAFVHAITRFNHFYGNGNLTLTGLAKATIRTFMTRELSAHRTIKIPEGTAKEIAKYKRFLVENPDADQTMELSEILSQAGVKMSVAAFLEAYNDLESSKTQSVHVAAEGTDEDSVNEFANNKFSDAGRHAEEIRSAGESPAFAILKEGIEKLPVIHQTILSCIYPSAVNEDAEKRWTEKLRDEGLELLLRSAKRIRHGAASPVAGEISVVFA